jgi:hypothetical protein
VITPVLLGAAETKSASNVVALRPSAKRSPAQRPPRSARNASTTTTKRSR